jgi:hypothetical protein
MANNFDFITIDYVPNNDFNFGKDFPIYRIIFGNSINYTSIWADSNANLETAKLYIGTAGTGATFSIIDLKHKVLVDNYTIDNKGNNNKFLYGEDIVDINVSIIGT